MSLRELAWAARAVDEDRWARTVVAVHWTVRAVCGAKLTRDEIAPGVFRDRPGRPPTPEEQARRDDLSGREFAAAFAAVYGG